MTRYEVFLRVIEMGSFTRAAEELGYTQSAVSQMVKTLEQELGSALLTRSHSGVVLTEDGKAYLPYIRAVCDSLARLSEKRREMMGLQSSLVRIGTFTSVSRNLLPKLMMEFRTLYPGVRFVLQQGEYDGISRWIREGSVDFGFVKPEAVSGLETMPLYRDEMQVVLAQDDPLAALEAVPLEALVEKDFILVDEGDSSVALDAFRQLSLEPRVQYKVYDDYTILAMVEQGLGYSMLYNQVLRGFRHHVAARPVLPRIERTVSLAWKNRETMPVACRRFVDFILERMPSLLD